MAMSRDAALIRYGEVYNDFRDVLVSDCGLNENEELNLSQTFEELQVSNIKKTVIYMHLRETLAMLPPVDEVYVSDFVTLRDMYRFAYQYYEKNLNFEEMSEVWKYFSRKVVKYSHPEKTQYKLAFTPEEVRWDSMLCYAFGIGQMEIDKIRNDLKNATGVTLPPIEVDTPFLMLMEDTLHVIPESEHSQFIKKCKEANQKEPAYEAPAVAASKEKPSCWAGLLYLFLLLLPFLALAGILALIFSHIY
ncbi:MAG: hypothetical protein LUG86_05015 [Oscillospiraceae bacterium]|nr:hypothetical protein [Oscillospiraceae bacterium]